MAEEQNSLDVLGSTTTPPAISTEGLSYMRNLLNDPAWVAAYPSHAVSLRQSFDTATKVTGQDKPETPDQRTPARQMHDRNLGIQDRPATEYQLEAPDNFTPAEGKTIANTLSEARELVAAMQLDPIVA